MALLTDGNPNDDEALRVYETEILTLAHTEGIDLPVKLGLATEEISLELIDLLLDRTRFADPLVDRRRLIGVSDVMVTRQMKRWHALYALALVYRDAFNNQLNDRYQLKWEEYRSLAREARNQVTHFGIGLVGSPLPRPTTPLFSSVAGLTPSTVYYVQVSWLNGVGQESSPSVLTTYQTAEGSKMVVEAVRPPAGATGWTVFIGMTDGMLTQQNLAPIGVSQAFTLPDSGLITGRAPGDGQTPDTYVTGGPVLRRA